MQERHNSIANILELRLSCTNPSIYSHGLFSLNWSANIRANTPHVDLWTQLCSVLEHPQISDSHWSWSITSWIFSHSSSIPWLLMTWRLQGARASGAMILTQFSRKYQVSALAGLSGLGLHWWVSARKTHWSCVFLALTHRYTIMSCFL